MKKLLSIHTSLPSSVVGVKVLQATNEEGETLRKSQCLYESRNGSPDELPSPKGKNRLNETAYLFQGGNYGDIPVSFFWVFTLPGKGLDLHRHPYEEVFVRQQDQATFTIGHATYIVRGGEIVIAPANTPHKFKNSGEDPLQMLSIHPSKKVIQENLEDKGEINMNPEVTEYIAKIDQPWQVEVCNRLRQIILQTVPEVDEVKLYNRPHYKKNGQYLCVFFVAKKWVNVTLFNASGLPIPQGYGEMSGNGDRVTAKIQVGQDFDYELFTKLLQQAAYTL